MPASKEVAPPTSLSKMIGLILMVLLPILGFLLGLRSQPLTLSASPVPQITNTPIPKHTTFSGSFEIAIAGAEAILTDRQGRRTGYDRTTMAHITEIPESMYFDSKIIPPGGLDNGKVVRNLILANTAGGFYNLEIIPPAGTILETSFDFSAVGYGPDYIIQSATAAGSLKRGNPQQFHIDFDPGVYLQIRSLEQ